MEVQNISFQANLINTINVGKRKGNNYIQNEVAFVEINPFWQNDLNALKNVQKYWQNDKFATNICQKGIDIYRRGKPENSQKIYALTAQTSDFKNIDDELILGVLDLYESSDGCIINNLQVKPDYVYKFDKEYSGIGTSILKSLQKKYDKLVVIPAKERSVKVFYQRNGFVEIQKNLNLMIWKKLISI